MSASTATAPVTAQQIADALTATDGNQSKAATLVGLNRSTFTRRLAALRAEVADLIAAAQAAEVEDAGPDYTGANFVGEEDGAAAAPVVLSPLAVELLDELRAEFPEVDEPAADEAPAPVEPVAVKHGHGPQVTACEKCGYKFVRPQYRRTCKVPAACSKRQAALVAAAAGE
jgi:regulatory Fis family protein